MFNHRLLRISSYVLWFKVGVDELVVLVWATPEFTQFSFLHVVKCDWVFLWEVVSYNIVHVILYSFGRSVCMCFDGQRVSNYT